MSTIYEKMEDVVKYYESHQPLKKATTTVYKDKTTQTELTTDAELLAAFKGGKSISDFEVTTDVVDPKKELTELIFGEEKPKSLQVVKFFKIISELTGLTFTAPELAKRTMVDSMKDYVADEEGKETKGKSDFAKKYASIKAALTSAINKVKELEMNIERSPDSVRLKEDLVKAKEKEAAKRLERVMLYIDLGKTPKISTNPKNSFDDLALYEKTYKAVVNQKEKTKAAE